MVKTLLIFEEDGTERQVDIASKEFAVDVNGELLEPVLTTEIELEYDSDGETVVDQCGNFQRNKLASLGGQMRVRGIITANQDRQNNLAVGDLKELASQSTANIVSELFSGEIVLDNILIRDENTLHSIESAGLTDGEERAFRFQMQLGEGSTE